MGGQVSELAGKTALVTGTAHGIGAAIAQTLASMGATVHGVDKDTVDVSDAAAVAGLIEQIGPVDVLVNNAGGVAGQVHHPIEEIRDADWRAVVDANLTTTFLCARAVIPGMKKRGWGRIINTASAHSLVASPFKSAYVSAKHGIAGLTKTTALELATFKITCNCISPGYVWTPLVEHQIPETMKARNMTKEQVIRDVLLDAQPTKEFVTSEQVAALALFLCGDDAAQITGANLSIDGGWTAE